MLNVLQMLNLETRNSCMLPEAASRHWEGDQMANVFCMKAVFIVLTRNIVQDLSIFAFEEIVK